MWSLRQIRDDSGVARPKILLGAKRIWGGAKCLILGKQQYFVWYTTSQSKK